MSNAPSADNQVAAAALKIGVGDENNEPIEDQKTKYQNNVEINRKVEFWQRRCLKNGVKVSDLDPKEHHCFAPNDATARMESNAGTFESTSHKTKAKEPIV